MSKLAGRKIAKTLGISAGKGMAYGLLKGVFVCIRNDAFTAALIFTVNRLSEDRLSDIRSYAQQNKKSLLFKDIQYEAPYLKVFLDSHYGPLTARRAAKSACDLAERLNSLGAASACASCGESEGSPAFQGDAVLYLCDGCYEKQKEAAGHELTQRNVTGSYLKGFLGAIIGGLIGIVPWVVFGLAGRIAAVSGLIMAYTCIKMYTMFRGRVGKPMIAIILFTLISFTVVGVFTAWVVAGFVEGYQDLNSIVRIIFSDMTITGIPGDIILGLFLAGLGSFFLLKNAYRTASGKDIAISRNAAD